MGVDESGHVADDEVLIVGQDGAEHVADDGDHGRGVEELLREGEEQDDKGEEREDDVGGDGEGVGVDMGGGHELGEGEELRPQTVLRDYGRDGDDRFDLGDGLVNACGFGFIREA